MVDQGFAARCIAVGIVALRVDAIAAAVLENGLPSDDVTAARHGGDGGRILVAGRIAVDPGLAAQCIAVAVIALRVDTLAAAVLDVRSPGDDIAAAGQGGDGGRVLVVGCMAVDPRFATLCNTDVYKRQSLSSS